MPCKSHNGAQIIIRAPLLSNSRATEGAERRRNAETRDRIMRFSNRGSAREERVFIKVSVVTKGLTQIGSFEPVAAGEVSSLIQINRLSAATISRDPEKESESLRVNPTKMSVEIIGIFYFRLRCTSTRINKKN